MKISKGTKVRILIHAGLVETADDSRFSGEALAGTVGEYVGPHPNKRLKDWHLVRVDEFKIAPLFKSQFEVVAEPPEEKRMSGPIYCAACYMRKVWCRGCRTRHCCCSWARCRSARPSEPGKEER